MDVGLYREDEQFSFTTSAYLGCYSNDSASYTIDQNELFEEIRPMPQPPNQIFEWHGGNAEQELDYDIDTDMIDHSSSCREENLSVSPPVKSELHTIFGIQNWQPIWQPTLNSKMEHTPIEANYISEGHVKITNKKGNDNLQEILELPEIAHNLRPSLINLSNVKIEDSCNSRIASGLSVYSKNNVNERHGNRTESESSDLLNASFSSTELTNFDIAEYVFEENKQTKKSIEVPEVKIEPVNIKIEPGLQEDNVDTQSMPNVIPKRAIKAGIKKIDLKAQRYIIEEDIKKSFSEDECDIDIETVSEEESSPVLEAGDLTDLLEQFEATEVKNKEQIISNNNQNNRNQQNVSLNINVEVKTEKLENKKEMAKPTIKLEPKIESKQNETIKTAETKAESANPDKIEPEKNISPKSQVHQQKQQEQLYLNNVKVQIGPTVKIQETTTSSNNRHILDSLPQELINRIKESGKRKPITVIQAIPNVRKRSKVQEAVKILPSISSDSVHLDHNYCSNSNSPSNQAYKKDSGFVSSEEDDRTIISRQPTVKNADGTLMVSLLKANTIRQLDCTKNQKKKLNLEEYKKRRNGILTPKNNSQNCSPNTSTCSSPLPEDEHQKMLKHQEKLRRMAQEVLNAAPKSEKKVEPSVSLLKVPMLFPLSPVLLISQPASPAKELPIKIEASPKIEVAVKLEESVETEKIVQPLPEKAKPIKVEPPKVPSNLERKVLVSFGVNTDFRIAKNEDPLAPVEKLQEIKPLLEKASSKISENSLIASVIENIPKVIDKNEKTDDLNTVVVGETYEHGDNKEVVYLERDRVRCETKEAETQTNISLIEQTKRGRIRRRVSSSSSCSSYKSKQSASSRRSRKSSGSSSCSRSSGSSHRSTSLSRCSEYSSRNSSRLSYSRSRSRSPRFSRRNRSSSAEREHLNAVEERRIIYVGKIETGTSKDDLRRKFQKFGPINKISLHFRDIGYSHLENYGFVTFKYKEDAHEAYERGNDDPSYPCYKISFGGRREFCKAAYSDLDNVRDEAYYQSQTSGDSYDQLLKEALEKLKKRKV